VLAGRPLISHTIDAARAAHGAGVLDRVMLSTDDEEIAEYARSQGCEVPFLRPAELARDETPHLPVVQHAVQWLATNRAYRPDAVVILQPTSPIRRADDIRQAVQLLTGDDVDSVVSVSAVPAHMNPMRMLRVDHSGRATLFVGGQPVRRRINRRQDMPEAWVMNGALYALRTRVLFTAEPSLYGDCTVALPLPDPFGISIDTPEDWVEAEKAIGYHHGS
jgi:CMP-N,N'-diacetyllegionaminic acid synthase